MIRAVRVGGVAVRASVTRRWLVFAAVTVGLLVACSSGARQPGETADSQDGILRFVRPFAIEMLDPVQGSLGLIGPPETLTRSTAEGQVEQLVAAAVEQRDEAATTSVTLSYTTANATATHPSDYTAKSGTLTFSAGQVHKTVAVPVKGDTAMEGDETFTLNLSNATGGATITDPSGLGTIVDDDGPIVPVCPPSIDFGQVVSCSLLDDAVVEDGPAHSRLAP